MKHFHKNQVYFTKKLVILLRILIFFIVIYIIFCTDLPKYLTFHIDRYEKYSFTDKELSLISDTIHIHCNNIEEMTYEHARSSCFYIYVSDFEEQDLDKNYTKSTDNYYGGIYVDKDPDTIYDTICYFEEYDNQDVLVIKVRDFDRTLYKIVKKKSTHTVL